MFENERPERSGLFFFFAKQIPPFAGNDAEVAKEFSQILTALGTLAI
jgi:hypothetical protein